MNKLSIAAFCLLILGQGCKSSNNNYDASGVFEATEVVVSSEANGKILALNLNEGDVLKAGTEVGKVDCDNLNLQKAQTVASENALSAKQSSALPQIQILNEQLLTQQKQIAVQRQQLAVLQKEQNRFERLVKSDAAPSKQLDDLTGQVEVLKKQIDASEGSVSVVKQQIQSQKEQIAIVNRGILSEKKPLEERTAQIENMISKCAIINPISGTVLVKYAEANEVTNAGKAIYKIANLDEMYLRAYITSSQLSKVKLNQSVNVMIDNGKDNKRTLKGTVSWISDKAEFTPKTIQTEDERQNLVYAVKVKVKNDGFVKIGMYGEVKF